MAAKEKKSVTSLMGQSKTRNPAKDSGWESYGSVLTEGGHRKLRTWMFRASHLFWLMTQGRSAESPAAVDVPILIPQSNDFLERLEANREAILNLLSKCVPRWRDEALVSGSEGLREAMLEFTPDAFYSEYLRGLGRRAEILGSLIDALPDSVHRAHLSAERIRIDGQLGKLSSLSPENVGDGGLAVISQFLADEIKEARRSVPRRLTVQKRDANAYASHGENAPSATSTRWPRAGSVDILGRLNIKAEKVTSTTQFLKRPPLPRPHLEEDRLDFLSPRPARTFQFEGTTFTVEQVVEAVRRKFNVATFQADGVVKGINVNGVVLELRVVTTDLRVELENLVAAKKPPGGEYYIGRTKPDENALQFFERVYGRFHDAGILYLDMLRAMDEAFVPNLKKLKQLAPDVPKRRDRTTRCIAKILESDPEMGRALSKKFNVE